MNEQLPPQTSRNFELCNRVKKITTNTYNINEIFGTVLHKLIQLPLHFKQVKEKSSGTLNSAHSHSHTLNNLIDKYQANQEQQ